METEFWEIYQLSNSEGFNFWMDFVEDESIGMKVLQCRLHKNCSQWRKFGTTILESASSCQYHIYLVLKYSWVKCAMDFSVGNLK